MAKTAEAKSKVVKLKRSSAKPKRGKAARLEFYTEIAAAARVWVGEVRRGMDAMRQLICHNLTVGKYTRIPGIVQIRVRNLRPVVGGTVVINGEPRTFKARPSNTRKVVAQPLQKIKMALA